MSVDLNNLKEEIQTILEDANTTTATVFLSEDLETRVQRVMKVNPHRIPVQASWYPFVSIFIDSKRINQQDIAATQLTAKRRAEIDVKIVGAVWNSTISDEEVDPADDDCESLMENIEEIIRRSSTLNGAALWTGVTDVTYHNGPVSEDAHVRAGFMNLKVSVLY